MDRKIYFASDFHLGIPNREKSLEREREVVQWLEQIKTDAAEIFLVGDVFDFWFEYGKVVPRGYVRLLGKIAEITDAGIPVHYFIGNHDMWTFGYLEEELNVQLHKEPVQREWQGKKFFIGHGDGLGPGDHGYKFIKKVFRNPVSQWLFARLHPNFGIALADFWSRRSRLAQGGDVKPFVSEEKEMLVHFARGVLEQEQFDYFIFGHRHIPLDIQINEKSRYINLGDWIKHKTYAVFDGEKLELKSFSASAAAAAD